MRIISYISLFIIFTYSLVSLKFSEGIYEYKRKGFYESINLYDGYKFKYNYRSNFISFTTRGNYRIIGDSLILDSHPQKNKIIVREQRKGKKNKLRFQVTDKLGKPIHYTLFIISKEKDTVVLPNQWNSSKCNNKEILSFYIIDSKGLKTPMYYPKGTRTNYFEVQMETDRVFENEVWKIMDDKIFTKGMDGQNQSYFLERI